MKIFSFTQDGGRMVPVEVELSLVPGLPQVQFTGLPDTAIKESVMRIKSAIRHEGFEWPRTRQIIINLRPPHLKKSSQGVELAIACALLWKTGQLPKPENMHPPFYIYGELLLDGSISLPENWESLPSQKEGILTGMVEGDNYLCPLFQASRLKEVARPVLLASKPLEQLLKPPKVPRMFFSQGASDLLCLVGAGEHSILLAGSAGSGKSTLIDHLKYILPAPDMELFAQSRRIWSQAGDTLYWRPFVSPHHSTTALSMIGGGHPLFIGEITKAHGGVLFMDEYLEFHTRVQEGLREPMEKGEIRVVRYGVSELFPAEFLLAGATNLCPCGDLEPGRAINCSYSLRRCMSYMNRLSGPMLDRFDILSFSHQWKGKLTVPLQSIASNVQKAYQFRLKRRQKKANAKLSLMELTDSLNGFLKDTQINNYLSSKRRRRALLRTARTFADLDESLEIKAHHIEKAKQMSLAPFVQLKARGFLP